jgi:Tfp pilus assembly protein PilZ
MQMAWLMTMFIFSIVFFLVFFAVYFFRPKKDDRIMQDTVERGPIDPEDIPLPHRAEPNWPAFLETSDGKTAEASITSVTHGSAFIRTAAKLSIGEKFQLTIHLPHRPHLQLRAQVTWSNMHLPAEKVLNHGMGIRFIEMGEDAICLVRDTINQRALTEKAGKNTRPGSAAESASQPGGQVKGLPARR